MTATPRFPFDVLASIVAATAICAAAVIHETGSTFPSVRRRCWQSSSARSSGRGAASGRTTDPRWSRRFAYFVAFFVAFAVVSESFAEIQHVRGFEARSSDNSTSWNLLEGRSIFRIWNRSAFPLPLPQRSPTKTPQRLAVPVRFR